MRNLINKIRNKFKKEKFSSSEYWEDRYQKGGTSGMGSYGDQAVAKAQVINDFVKAHQIQRIVELGCGDGNQLTYAQYPNYIGFDVSKSAVELCQKLFKSDETKEFIHQKTEFIEASKYESDASMSLEVIFHLVEDNVYWTYLDKLVELSSKYIIVFSTNRDQKNHKDIDGNITAHLRHREFAKDLVTKYPVELISEVDNPHKEKGDMKFYFFKKKNA